MTVRLLIDTDIWLNLAKDYRMAPVLTAIRELINAKACELIMPQVVLDEFARNRDRVVEDSKRSLSSHFKRVREAVAQFADDEKKAAMLGQLNEIDHKIAMTGEVSKPTLETIEKLMATSPAIATSDAVKIKAAERALAKLAPFHLSKNSVGDAALIEIYAEAIANEANKDDEYVFVTNNTRDFSQHNGDQRLPHADLEPLFQGKSRYATSIAEVIKDIGGEELLEEYEWEHTYHQEARRLSEILDAEHLLFRQVWYNRHWGLRHGVETGKIKIITSEEFNNLKGYHPEVVVDSIWNGALAAAKRTEEEVGLDNLGPWDDFEWGMINGKLSALRWVLGDEWDMLDT
jgi:hypothetical protein